MRLHHIKRLVLCCTRQISIVFPSSFLRIRNSSRFIPPSSLCSIIFIVRYMYRPPSHRGWMSYVLKVWISSSSSSSSKTDAFHIGNIELLYIRIWMLSLDSISIFVSSCIYTQIDGLVWDVFLIKNNISAASCCCCIYSTAGRRWMIFLFIPHRIK